MTIKYFLSYLVDSNSWFIEAIRQSCRIGVAWPFPEFDKQINWQIKASVWLEQIDKTITVANLTYYDPYSPLLRFTSWLASTKESVESWNMTSKRAGVQRYRHEHAETEVTTEEAKHGAGCAHFLSVPSLIPTGAHKLPSILSYYLHKHPIKKGCRIWSFLR